MNRHLLRSGSYSASALLLLLLLWTTAAFAASEFDCRSPLSAEENRNNRVISEVEKFYEKLQTLEGKFVQTSYAIGLNRREESRGRVFFKKPGLMDWWYDEPAKDKQRFVSDGKFLWMYQPASEQVFRRDFQESFTSDLPVSFLLGIGRLSERFRLESGCHTDAGTLLKLLPQKEDASLDEFSLLVDGKSFSPLGARLVDAGGNETAIVFSDVRFNSPIEASHFQFEIPRGVDVVPQGRQS